MVLLFTVLGISNIDDADAAHATINCLTGVLLPSEIYVVDQSGFLHKIEQSDGHSCVVGKMVTSLSAPAGPGIGSTVICQDIAIDHSSAASPQTMYCLDSGTALRTIARIPSNCAFNGDIATCEVLAGPATPLTIGAPAATSPACTSPGFALTGGEPVFCKVGEGVSFMNAMENDGTLTYVADFFGRFWNLNLSTGVLTIRTDYGVLFPSSGDLVHDGLSPSLIYWSVQRCPTTAPENCADVNNDALYTITLVGAGPDPIAFFTDLGEPEVFAADLVPTTNNICVVSHAGNLQEFDRTTGSKIGATKVTQDIITGAKVLAFGGVANLVGGFLLFIDNSSLLLAGMATNSVWLILFMVSGVAVIAYQFKSKTKN